MMNRLADRIKYQGFKPQVLTEQVALVLTEMILDGTLEPGGQLIETELQKHLGISRSHLRDLARRGLVTQAPRKGTFVGYYRLHIGQMPQNHGAIALIKSFSPDHCLGADGSYGR